MQEERWLTKYNEVVAFIEKNKRNPSKHRIEEHDMLNWLKANRKAINAGKMKPERVGDARDVICKNQMVDIDKSVIELLV